jgi:hypothetical protein
VSMIKYTRVQNEAIISFVHGNTNDFKEVHPHGYVSKSTNNSLSKDHKIRTGIQPVSSNNRSCILPLNYPIITLNPPPPE